MTCQLPPALSLTAALWFQRGQLMHFVSTTRRRAVRCARAYVQFLVRRSVLVSCYCKAVQNSAQHISITILKSGDPADREAVALRTVQKCITARFLVARQRLRGDVQEKKILFKSVRINFGRGIPPDLGNSKKTGCFLGVFPKYNENVEKIIASEKKVRCFTLSWCWSLAPSMANLQKEF